MIQPDISELLKLEQKARVEGSGIEADSLIGVWNFKTVWKKGSNIEDKVSSIFLNLLSANLELKKDQEDKKNVLFSISNSIKFGFTSLKFSGTANLERKQPILAFSFDFINIEIASLTILKRSLPKPDTKKRPFFALIALDKNGKWLCARGKGGGLALWYRN